MKLDTKKILIIDEDEKVCQILQMRLSALGYIVSLMKNENDAITIFEKEKPDLVILDIFLSNVDGYSTCFKLCQKSEVPIIILTALGDIPDRILGLHMGADDYIVKPFSLKEFEYRINSNLQRIKNKSFNLQSTLKKGNLEINIHKKQIFKNQINIKLTLLEFSLLEFLIIKAGEKLSRSFILSKVWGYIPERYIDMRIVDVYISRLRAKLEDNPNNPDYIITIRGLGYMFQQL